MDARFGPKTITGIVAAVVIIGGTIIGVLWHWAISQPGPVANSAETQQAYATLYDVAWRQDDGTGSATATATLFVPRLRELLAAAGQRSSTDQQILQALTKLSAADVPVVVTIDAVAGSEAARLTDAAVQKSLTLTAQGAAFTLKSMTSIVSPAVPTNTNAAVGTVHRIWLVAFSPSAAFDWTTVENVQLTVAGVGEKPRRVFTWPRPSILTDR